VCAAVDDRDAIPRLRDLLGQQPDRRRQQRRVDAVPGDRPQCEHRRDPAQGARVGVAQARRVERREGRVVAIDAAAVLDLPDQPETVDRRDHQQDHVHRRDNRESARRQPTREQDDDGELESSGEDPRGQ
jgi:hypothetical protein